MKLGTRVKELAKERGMSVAQVERLADIKPKSISGWDIHKPSADKVDRVIDVLEITHDEFYQKDKKISLSLSNISKNIHDAVMADLQYSNDVFLTEEEADLVYLYRKASERDKKLVHDILDEYKEDTDSAVG